MTNLLPPLSCLLLSHRIASSGRLLSLLLCGLCIIGQARTPKRNKCPNPFASSSDFAYVNSHLPHHPKTPEYLQRRPPLQIYTHRRYLRLLLGVLPAALGAAPSTHSSRTRISNPGGGLHPSIPFVVKRTSSSMRARAGRYISCPQVRK